MRRGGKEEGRRRGESEKGREKGGREKRRKGIENLLWLLFFLNTDILRPHIEWTTSILMTGPRNPRFAGIT